MIVGNAWVTRMKPTDPGSPGGTASGPKQNSAPARAAPEGLASAPGHAVMPIGGFGGMDPSPTLAQFQQYVAEGRIHYFLGGELGGRQNGGSEAASEIATWVAENYTAQTVGNTTVYDLTQK